MAVEAVSAEARRLRQLTADYERMRSEVDSARLALEKWVVEVQR